ncbi:hypothetical protein [Sporosarcina ureae]|uniref:Uncharacterized protein n=1 Tax=Sporosarcina ureae TaxID=1571 RepID=A0ABM6JS61_SPOUR|nr:hypothetical protein [Sporosarcina ureae]ARF13031.1 hypothetical protein SporoS204_01855 [Sporosarcina ureae]
MIKNRTALISAVVLLAICMFLFFPYPNNPLIGATVTFMSFPIQADDRLVWKGLVGTLLFLIAMALLIYGLKKFYVVLAVLVLFLYALIPVYLITAYQETIASGIGAISYDQKGKCAFDTLDDNERMSGDCQLTLKNHSKKPVSFELEFLDTGFGQDEMKMVSLMNIAGPFRMTIEGNRTEFIELNEILDVSNVPDRIYSGSTSDVHFKIIEGKKERIF